MAKEIRYRFLFLAPRFHTNQCELVNLLLEKGHEVRFVALSVGGAEDHTSLVPDVVPLSALGITINKWRNPKDDPAIRGRLGVPSLPHVWRILLQFKPDVIITRGVLRPYFLTCLPFALRTRILVYTQDPLFVGKLSVYRKSVYFVFLSLFRFRWFTPVEHLVPKPTPCKRSHKRMSFIPFFKSIPPNVAVRSKSGSSRLRVLGVGKLIPRKGLLETLGAIQCLDPTGEKIDFVWIGECSTPEHQDFKTQVDLHPARNRLRLLTNLPLHAVQEEYCRHDLFVLPSKNEPASVSQVEAMAHGLPIICSSESGTAHYVEDGVNGFVIEPCAAAIAVALQQYLDDPHLVERHSANSLHKMRSRFSITTAYQALISLVEA
ncbi:MAG TPA: hypothetical protein DDW52_26730 [Planctomycetaceae bacterium]|nr:hypothetical protein [Planctomycetaceae bacterium]